MSTRSAGRVEDARVLSLPFPDAAARARIAGDLDTNLLVEAGAGSGKTTELVGRMVALLETGAARADEIAAVTFTRKAAGELRERFQMDVERRLHECRLAGEAAGAAAERLARGLDDIDRAFVGTIHAFCARLLRERPLEVGLDPSFEEMAVEERNTLRTRFWRAYLERLTRESDPILEELARGGLKAVGLYELFFLVAENPDVEFRADPAPPGSTEELAGARVELESLVDRAWELMPERAPDGDWDSLQKKLRALHFSKDVTGWTEAVDVYEALGALCKGGKGHAVTQNRWRNGARAKALRDDINRFAVGDTPARRLHLRWLAHRYALAVRLARHAAEEYAAHRRRIGRLDFGDLLVLAAELLRANPSVRRDLGTRYRRLLVDEFQDTDPLQAEIMLLLASEPDGEGEAATAAWRSAVPRAGALFVVGDPKQSIYRFRRADIQLYGWVKERFREFGEVVELTTNFRSRPPIGDLVNQLFVEQGFFPRASTQEQAAFEPLNTRPPVDPVVAEGVFSYAIAASAKNAGAAARDDAARLASWIRDRVDRGERRPGDFLILTRAKARLDEYARALEAHSLPVEVTGAGVGAEEEIRELIVVLESLLDPSNPVKVVAALVGLCFGLDYERLLAHRLEGGGFDAMRPGDHGHPDVLDALRALHGWWRASSAEPADTFVSRLVSEIGLLPFAAAGDLGAVRAGALVYALDAVRASALAGDASLPGAITAMSSALALAEAEAPLEPARPDVVRLMNLHQAKGLEARVVVLADPGKIRDHAPSLRVERGDDGRAVGFARVGEASDARGGDKDVARPADWEAMADIERRFEAAEEVRLLYVAVTRAQEELVVVRWPDHPDVSPWRSLHRWLDEHATPLPLEARAPAPRASLDATADSIERSTAAAATAIARGREPTYVRVSVTEVAEAAVRGAVAGAAELAEAGPGAAVPLRGYSWGSAVHGALAAAAQGQDAEALRATCRDLLLEHGRPLDDHGEPLEVEELTGLVRGVQASALWARAKSAERMLSEIAFAAPGWSPVIAEEVAGTADPAGPSRPQLDLFGGEPQRATDVSAPARGGVDPATVLEGVIDLTFREQDGWVVVDFKTDVGRDPAAAAREAAYRRQVDLYAEAWSRLTGEPVKERVLVFTAQGREERW